jgi:hypothetical protein
MALLLCACGDDGGATDLGSATETNATMTGDGDTTTGNATTGDGDGDGDNPNCTPELEALRADVFTPSCALASCHASMDAAGGLDLETQDLEGQLVSVPSGTCDGWIRVVPGVPEESLLYAKLEGTAPCGSLMPPPEGGLPAEQIACVRTWIENLEGPGCETCGGNACVDLQSDAEHCGACDNACPMGIACVSGSCACPDGQQTCAGACVDTSADPQHCGGCGTACTPNEVCSMGTCTQDCGQQTNCGGACVDLQSNIDHCGMCGYACPDGSTCEAGMCTCPGDGVSFVNEVEPILAGTCTGLGCHGFPAPAEGLDLRTGVAYDALVGVPSSECGNRMLVAPGQPQASYLLDKLLGVNLCFGTPMPKAAPPLSAGEIATISEWICRGAQNN